MPYEERLIKQEIGRIAGEFWREVRSRSKGNLLNAEGYERRLCEMLLPMLIQCQDAVELAEAERDLANSKHAKVKRTLGAIKLTATTAPDTLLDFVLQLFSKERAPDRVRIPASPVDKPSGSRTGSKKRGPR